MPPVIWALVLLVTLLQKKYVVFVNITNWNRLLLCLNRILNNVSNILVVLGIPRKCSTASCISAFFLINF